MRAITVNLSVIAVIMVVIFSSSNAEVTGYLSQSVYQGQTVFLNNEVDGFINNEQAPIVHTGLVYTDSFVVRDITLVNGIDTVLVDHSVGGTFGKPTYKFTNITSLNYELQENLTLDDWYLSYEGSFETEDGLEMYVYNYGNLSVGITEDDFSIIQDDGRSLLLQQSGNVVTVAEIEEPFQVGVTEILFLFSILVVVSIVAYWYMRGKTQDWEMTR